MPPEDDASERSWPRTIAAVAHRIESEDYPPGDLAALRRLDVDVPDGRAFWALLVRLAPQALDDERMQRALAVVVRGMAIACPFHRPREGDRRPLGRALAEADVSELRLLRLLRAEGDRLGHELLTLARLVRSRGEDARFDWHDVLRLLLLSPDHEPGQRHRRRLARDYYARALQTEKETAA